MSRILGTLAMLLLPLQVWAAEGPADAPALDRLSASLERLAGAVEREAALRAEEREARRVEVAVAIIGLRSAKIVRLETEIRQLIREEEEIAARASLMKAEAGTIAEDILAPNHARVDDAKTRREMIDLRLQADEDRARRARERRLQLENELTAERRRLVGVEAVLDAWMAEQ